MNKNLLWAMMPLMTACSGQQEPQKPNIIYIMCDDLGYNDLACYGQQYINTPNLDRMASEGMRFTQAYAGSPVSAPSRASFMTGQHTGHTEVRGNKEYWKDVPMIQMGVNEEFSRVGQHPYDPEHVILPEIMKDQGYTTGMFGKWAGGYEGSVSTPDKRGTKRQTHEGGVRVPFIAWGPGMVPAGVVNDHQLAFYDLMPTFCELAGVEDYVAKYTNPNKEVDYFDGLSFAKTLTDKEGQQAHDFLYWEFEETNQVAVRMGDWKMVSKAGKPHLYDLSKDVHEDNDIAEQHPDIVKKLVEIAHSQHIESPYFKVTMPVME